MPRALAIETSGRVGSVALVEDGRVVAEAAFGHGLQHAATLLPRVDAACRRLGWTPGSIGQAYVSVGPGSFTGLRVGVTLAKTLAFATGARLVAVPTARVLLANAPPEAREIVIVLDAKRGQVFAARFVRSDATEDWTEAEPAHLDTLASVLARAGRPVHLIGEGLPYHTAAVDAANGVAEDGASVSANVSAKGGATGPAGGVIVTDESLWPARAAAVAALGIAAAARGEFADAFTLTPLYIRLPEPEEKRLAAEAAAAQRSAD